MAILFLWRARTREDFPIQSSTWQVEVCHNKFGPPFLFPPVHIFRTPALIFLKYMHVINYSRAEIQKGQGRGSGLVLSPDPPVCEKREGGSGT